MSVDVAFVLRVRNGATGDSWFAGFVDDRGQTTWSSTASACAAQAACMAVRHGRRQLRFDGAHRMVRGEQVPCTSEELKACPVSERDWTWQHHGHTHGPGRTALAVSAL